MRPAAPEQRQRRAGHGDSYAIHDPPDCVLIPRRNRAQAARHPAKPERAATCDSYFARVMALSPHIQKCECRWTGLTTPQLAGWSPIVTNLRRRQAREPPLCARFLSATVPFRHT
jgi:hypothetical protein